MVSTVSTTAVQQAVTCTVDMQTASALLYKQYHAAFAGASEARKVENKRRLQHHRQHDEPARARARGVGDVSGLQ